MEKKTSYYVGQPVGTYIIIAFFIFIISAILSLRYVEFFSGLTLVTFLPPILIIHGISTFCKNHKIMPVYKNIIMTVLLLVFIFFINLMCLPYYRDIPYALNKKYVSVNGIPSNVSINRGVKSSSEQFTIGGIDFSVDYNQFNKKLEYINNLTSKQEINGNLKDIEQCTYTIFYLPNSKYVINITQDK